MSDLETNSLPEQNLGGSVTKRALIKQAAQEAVWHKVLVMLDKKEYSASSFLIAEKLGCKVEEVLYALESMEHLGWVYKEKGAYKRNEKVLDINVDNLAHSEAELLHYNWLLMQQILQSSISSKTYKLKTQFMLTDQKVLKEYAKKREELNDWFIEASENSKKDKLVEEAWVAGSTLKENKERQQ